MNIWLWRILFPVLILAAFVVIRRLIRRKKQGSNSKIPEDISAEKDSRRDSNSSQKLKIVFQELWRKHKVVSIILIVVLLAIIGFGIYLFVSYQQSKLPSKQYEIAFVRDALPEKDVVLLEEVREKILADKVEAPVYRQAHPKQLGLMTYYIKYKGEDGYHLYYDYLETRILLPEGAPEVTQLYFSEALRFFGVSIVQEIDIEGGVLPHLKGEIDTETFEKKLKTEQIALLLTEDYLQATEYFVKFKNEDGYYRFIRPVGYVINIEVPGKAAITVMDLLLQEHRIPVRNVPANPKTPFPTYMIFIWVGFIVLFFLFFWFILVKGTRSGMSGFNKFKKRDIEANVSFDDIAGIEEAKRELREVVDFLKKREDYENVGARVPKGILLIGPPGTGKTMMARAVATELKASYLSMSGSEFVEMFVGTGAARVRDLFDEAKKIVKKEGHCIIFIDEVDALGRKRGSSFETHDERQNTTNEIMVRMDGIGSSGRIIVLAATNRADILDEAFTRPGRFDRKIVVGYPDVKGREAILKVHTKNKPIAPDVDFTELAKGIPLGSSGADIANIVNEAAIHAGRRRKKEIGREDFRDARDKIMLGLVKEGEVITEEEKKIYAYHEAGHAVAVKVLSSMPPINKVSILSRGQTHGVVEMLPEKDKTIRTKKELLDYITVALASVAAEEMIFGSDGRTTGAQGDLEQATRMAMGMVSLYGMSDDFGPVSLKAILEAGSSAFVTEKIIQAVREINEKAKSTARELIENNKEKLDAIAQALIEEEDIEGERAEKIIEKGEYPLPLEESSKAVDN